MKKLFQRLLIFFIGLPVLFVVIIFLPHFNHLAFNCIVTAISILGAVEFQNFLKQKNFPMSPKEAVVLGGIGPVMTTTAVCFNISLLIIPAVFILGALWVLVSRVFSSREKLEDCLVHCTAGFSALVYPGLFTAWIILLSLLPRPGIIIIVLLLITYLNDAGAWAAGIAFGKGNQGIVPASPNKSIAGFAGGLAGSVIVGLCALLWAPEAFGSPRLPGLAAGVVLGLVVGAAASLGDLGESALKRSAGLKDSGFIIPGRGGVLDSIDSLAAAAPVFYILYKVLFE
jgi:phosphatidate cytidylyltransferase